MNGYLLLSTLFCLFALYVAPTNKIQAMVDKLHSEKGKLYEKYQMEEEWENWGASAQASQKIDECTLKLKLLAGSDETHAKAKSEAQLKSDLAALKAKKTENGNEEKIKTLEGLLKELGIHAE
ncbi:hypothetical protein DdX_17373 [Ditylenchus destructor]|uniref:Uncharacterized protein n=1 Tax=Ditylenchus destructor TaxID=166010 RepID=A0AAD4MLH2_9BILA|nr:hypothetical protein DdX_17373 [Ditylenchus destructor]